MGTLGTLITATTFGTWLRGDARGWIDDGILMPPDPALEAGDRKRMAHPPFLFPAEAMLSTGDAIGTSLRHRLDIVIFALAVQSWHFHLLVGPTQLRIDQIVKCAKDAARYHLRLNQPIWTEGYDKRFCFDRSSLTSRVHYVERHNERLGWPSRPWSWITPFEQALS
jgi:hypothetical protein